MAEEDKPSTGTGTPSARRLEQRNGRAMKALEMTGNALMGIFLVTLVGGVIVGGAFALYKAGSLFYVLGGLGAIAALWGGIFTYLTVKPSKHSTDEDDEYE